MEKYSFATRKLISSPRILQRKLTLRVSSTDQLNEPLKVAEHSFQEPMPNSPLLLSYLCFGARFMQESRLTTEEFLLAFWQVCAVAKWFLFIFKKIQSSFFIICPLRIDIKSCYPVNTVIIKFWHRRFSQFAVNSFLCMFCIVRNSLCQNSDFLRWIIHVVSKLFLCQISWN